MSGTLDGTQGSVHYYRFRVGLSMIVELRLRDQDADADLVLEDADGVPVAEARSSGSADELISKRLEPGLYYIRVEAQEPGANSYELRYKGLLYTTPLDLGDLTDRMPFGLLKSYVAASVGDPSNRVNYFRFSLSEPRTLHLVMWRLEGDLDLFVEDLDGTVLRASRTSGTVDESLDVTLAAGTWHFVVRPQQVGQQPVLRDVVRGLDARRGPARDGSGRLRRRGVQRGAPAAGRHHEGQDRHAPGRGLVLRRTGEGPHLPDRPGRPGAAVRPRGVGRAGNLISEETDPGGGSNGSPSLSPGSRRHPDTMVRGHRRQRHGRRRQDSRRPDGRLGPERRTRRPRSIDESDGFSRSAPSSDPPGGGGGADSTAFGDGWVQITPKETGTYYVSTRSEKGTGDYEVSLRQVVDDYSADTTTAGTVAVDGSTTGEIEEAGDTDWFAVVLETGKAYLVDLMGAQTGDGTLRDPYLAGIHDSGGRRISGTTNDDRGAGTNSRVRFTPTSDGTYYVAARGAGNRIGTYTLAVTEQPDDFPSGTGTTGTVAVGGTATGEIEAEGDLDWFKVTLEANKTYRFDAMGAQLFQGLNGTLKNPYIDSLHRADGTRIPGTHINDYGSYWDARIDYTSPTAGTYYLSVGGYGEGTYTVAVTDITSGAPDDHPADTTTTGTIDVGGTATGEIQFAGDIDWFGVTLQANRTYYIDLMGIHLGKGTLDWPGLFGIHDSAGTLIGGTANNDTFDGNSSSDREVFTPTTTGVYYVAAGGAQLIVRLGTYTLLVTDMTPGQADDHPATTASTATVAVDGSVVARSEQAGDQDWYKVSLAANKVYRFDLMGAWSGDGTLDDPVLHGIRRADGTLIAGTGDDNSGTYFNSRTFFTPSTPRTTSWTRAAGAWAPTRLPSPTSPTATPTTTTPAPPAPPARWTWAARPPATSAIPATVTGSR